MKLVKWEASWCKPCSEYSAVFDKVVKDWNVPFEKIDVDEQPDRATAANVVSLPTTSVYNNEGEEVYRLLGKRQEPELVDVIKEFKDA